MLGMRTFQLWNMNETPSPTGPRFFPVLGANFMAQHDVGTTPIAMQGFAETKRLQGVMHVNSDLQLDVGWYFHDPQLKQNYRITGKGNPAPAELTGLQKTEYLTEWVERMPGM